MSKCKCSIPDDNFYGICGACHKDLDVEENLWKIDMPKVEFEHSEQSCICPACGTEWVDGDPQKCSTVIRDEINTLESKLAKAREALEFYANKNNWDSSGIAWQNQTVRDYGSKASEVLKEIE